MISYVAFVVLGSILGAQAQVPSLGGCPKVATIDGFDLDRYLGHWYEQARFSAIFEAGQVCANANYSIKDDGHIKIYNYGQDKSGKTVEATGDAYIPDKNDAGKLKLRFSSSAPYGDYWIVDTDYDNYTLIYSCTDFIVTHLELAWVLTRDKEIDLTLRESLFTKLGSYGVKTSNFNIADNTNCPTHS